MGRHREFDVDEALDAALDVFWRKGYEGASFDDLSRATGVARPGLYAAFGNKESFFRLAVDRYEATFTAFAIEALKEPKARDVVRRLLEGSAALQAACSEPRGCMVVNGAMTCSDETETLRREMFDRRAAAEAALRQRFERARDEGDLPPSSDCAMLASYVMTLSHGITVQGKAGASKATLDAVVAHAVATWPS